MGGIRFRDSKGKWISCRIRGCGGGLSQQSKETDLVTPHLNKRGCQRLPSETETAPWETINHRPCITHGRQLAANLAVG